MNRKYFFDHKPANVSFEEISVVGLRSLRSCGGQLATDLRKCLTKYKTITELRLTFDCGEDL